MPVLSWLRPPRRQGSSRYGAAGRVINVGVLLLALAIGSARATETAPVVVAVLGDSLVAGYNIAAEEAFPARLEAALRARGHQVRVLNAGVSGDTTAGGLARLDWTLSDRPDAVIVELGANDGLRGLDPERTRANLDTLVTRLKGAGKKVLLAGMQAPPNMGRDYAEAFNAIYPALAAKHQVLFDPFFLEGVAGVPALNLSDGIHPNPAGVDVMVARLLPLAEKLVEGQQP
ncbi:arylesterase [Pararhodospirillum photometricum]|uniref:Lipolytic enzyme, G-D-S-L n=1 Tax=Pararhodospirillum photometricum DSM 122 TaxID=1150469 RepID=H6SJC9_PARPM|nr:arylesterase [Pararhodospirillum photometricum]CCG08094.1 Lipolytic enzyme, G-D-S-L [Pararhodospirillum photometricum DSM 122]